MDEVFAVVKRDADYYRDSGGGVTVSGGEVLLQPEFARALLQRFREAGFHTCVDTSGDGDRGRLRALIPYVDLFYFDIKHIDSRAHRAETGRPNEKILRNFDEVAASGVPVVVRTPVIPGFNDTVDAIADIADLVATRVPGGTMHLLPYHRYGQQKYEMLGLEYECHRQRGRRRSSWRAHERSSSRAGSNARSPLRVGARPASVVSNSASGKRE